VGTLITIQSLITMSGSEILDIRLTNTKRRTITDSHDGDDYPTDELRVTPVSYIVRSVSIISPDARQLSGAGCISEAVMLGVSVKGYRY